MTKAPTSGGPAMRGVLIGAGFLAPNTQARNPRAAEADAFTALRRPAPFPQALAILEGDEGTIELREGYGLLVHDAQGRREEDVEPAVPPWGERPWHVVRDSVRSFQRHVLSVLRGEAAPQPSGADNLWTLAPCLAACGSAEQGRRVPL